MRRPVRFLHLALASASLVALTLAGAGDAVAQAKTATGASKAGATTTTATKRGNFSADDIDVADYTGGDLPPGQSALTAKVQLLLDRAGTSPGVIDGFRGGMSESALKAFERRHSLPIDGRMDSQIWELLQPYATAPITTNYTITQADAEGLVDKIPTDYAEKAAMEKMAYTSVAERLAERFHMDEKFIVQLNRAVAFEPGNTIRVVVPPKPIRTKVDRVFVDKATGRVAAYAGDKMVVDYPATVGSAATPSPHGTVNVTRVALNPDYTYNPNINFKQGDNDQILKVPPGPNGPVGSVWIALSKPTYGIHGTPTPSKLFVSQSHGCVRLTNWDAEELAHMVQPGKTVVEFLAPGISIAQAVGMDPKAATGEGVTTDPTTPLDAAGVTSATADTTVTLSNSSRPRLRPGDLSVRTPVEPTAATTNPADTVPTTTETLSLPESAKPTGPHAADPLANALDAAGAAVLPQTTPPVAQ